MAFFVFKSFFFFFIIAIVLTTFVTSNLFFNYWYPYLDMHDIAEEISSFENQYISSLFRCILNLI